MENITRMQIIWPVSPLRSSQLPQTRQLPAAAQLASANPLLQVWPILQLGRRLQSRGRADVARWSLSVTCIASSGLLAGGELGSSLGGMRAQRGIHVECFPASRCDPGESGPTERVEIERYEAAAESAGRLSAGADRDTRRTTIRWAKHARQRRPLDAG